MSSYLLESIDHLSIDKKIKEIITKHQFNDASINSYDLEETDLENALEDLDTYGFLSSKKVIVIKNIETIKYDEAKEKLKHLFKYIQNPNPDNLLIITSSKLNNTLKITKELKKICEYILIEMDTKRYIKEALKDYKIDQSTVNYLDEYCLQDLTKIENECNKLKNYKIEDKTITKEDIDEIVVKKMGDSKELTFQFATTIGKRDKKRALELYKELLSYQVEPLSIIGLLASQIRIIYQVKLLSNKHLSDKEIANILEEKSDYRIRKTKELLPYYTEEELLHLMQELSKIDYRIKTEDVNGNDLMELFLINL